MPDPETDTRIVRVAIHPGIGIARVGNSTSENGPPEYTIGPEVTASRPTSYDSGEDPMRDAKGNIKRQAARFRLYGYNAAGEAVREIKPDDADVDDITWTVHVANRKAEWFRFVMAMDVPEAISGIKRRNPNVLPDKRSDLVIAPGPKTLSTRSGASVAKFDGGTITFASPKTGDPVTTEVPLGEMRFDETGRLVVLGGLGKSDSPVNAPIYDENDRRTFNNADGWYDDISDGPVHATVTMDGQTVEADPAWVAVAPPNYAPDAVGWRTLYDLLQHTYIEAGRMDMPETINFSTHILPILYRLTNLQWVNAGFASMFGADGAMDFSKTEVLKKLSRVPETDTDGTPIDPYQELRRTVFHSFRSQDPNVGNEPRTWPWIYGDGFGIVGNEAAADNNLPLPSVWEVWMETWVAGDFVEGAMEDVDANAEPELTRDRYLEITTGYDPNDLPPDPLSALPVKDQPAMLDQANLHFCLADAFHPGCELTWPMRHNSIYASPFRIRHAKGPKPPIAGTFSPEKALAVGGPLYGQRPGDLTRWMAIPWQGDTASCRSGYHPEYDPYLPTFWPASAPNQVLAEEDYETIMSEDATDAERVAAFHRRRNWLRGLFDQKGQPAQMKKMITDFVNMGFVERRDGPKNHPHIPSVLYVEMIPDHHKTVVRKATAEMDAHGDGALASTDHVAVKAGFTSQEHVEEMQRMWKGGRS